jgi:hypothetical protein
MRPPRDGVSRPMHRQRINGGSQPGHQRDHRDRTQSRALMPAALLPHIERACDSLVHAACDTAALARRTNCAKHAESVCYLTDAVHLIWRAREALAENEAVS